MRYDDKLVEVVFYMIVVFMVFSVSWGVWHIVDWVFLTRG